MIRIEHTTTADMEDGQALPPFWDGNAWHVVRRFPNQQTLWRRISLQTTQQGSAAASCAEILPAANQGTNSYEQRTSERSANEYRKRST